MRLPALPKIPILQFFNGADEDFPARCTMLFKQRAEKYLDMECLAITGWALPDGAPCDAAADPGMIACN